MGVIRKHLQSLDNCFWMISINRILLQSKKKKQKRWVYTIVHTYAIAIPAWPDGQDFTCLEKASSVSKSKSQTKFRQFLSKSFSNRLFNTSIFFLNQATAIYIYRINWGNIILKLTKPWLWKNFTCYCYSLLFVVCQKLQSIPLPFQIFNLIPPTLVQCRLVI